MHVCGGSHILAPDMDEIYTIENCARCGQTHPVTFKPLTNPPEIYDPLRAWGRGSKRAFGLFTKIVISKFGICPTTGEPILMNVKPE